MAADCDLAVAPVCVKGCMHPWGGTLNVCTVYVACYISLPTVVRGC